jgi:hypothetical protein
MSQPVVKRPEEILRAPKLAVHQQPCAEPVGNGYQMVSEPIANPIGSLPLKTD